MQIQYPKIDLKQKHINEKGQGLKDHIQKHDLKNQSYNMSVKLM